MRHHDPLATGTNGDRDEAGRFVPGNKAATGTRQSRVQQFRAKVHQLVTDDDLEVIIGRLVEQAKQGEAWAIRELLDRLIGRPAPAPAEPDESQPGYLTMQVYEVKIPEARERVG